MDMVQIGLIGAAGALLAVQFKSGKAEYGIYISIALRLEHLRTVVSAVRKLGDYIRMDQAYVGTLVKMMGITYIAEFSSSICKDAGYQTIAAQIEIFGKLSVLVLSMPVLTALLGTIQDFLT